LRVRAERQRAHRRAAANARREAGAAAPRCRRAGERTRARYVARRRHSYAASRGARRADRDRARSVGQLATKRLQVHTGRALMRKLPTKGVHHITIVGAGRRSTIDFWEGVLGMPFVFEQPNLDNEAESHLYFDPGDGRLITIFTNEERDADPDKTPTEPGCVHHLAFALSQATFAQAVERLEDRGI